MLSSQKKLKSQFHENLWIEGRADLIHITLLAMHGQESFQRRSQLNGIAVDSKDKIQYNSA